MKLVLLAAAVSVCAAGSLGASSADTHNPAGNLAVSFTPVAGGTCVLAHLSEAWGPRFVVAMSRAPDISAIMHFATGTLNASGMGTARLPAPPQHAFGPEEMLWVRASFLGPFGRVDTPWKAVGLNPPCERLNFNFDAESNQLPAGLIVDSEWSPVGIDITAQSSNPAGTDTVIIFDSAHPTGGDFDLQTPGYGPGNTQPLGNLLIIAENLIDANMDGLVDDPDDDEDGGIIRLAFDEPVTMCSLALIDLDDGGIGSTIRFFNGSVLTNVINLPSMGDNSFQEVVFFEENVTLCEVQFMGSGGIPYMGIIPCPVDIDFDASTLGTPLLMPAGTVLGSQLASIGVSFEAFNNHPSHPDKAILFDSANPTGGDSDLQTPGYGVNNALPERLLMILAENDVDANLDGLVDVPDDEAMGGVLAVDFDFDIEFRSATVIDVDSNEMSFIQLFDSLGAMVASFPLAPLGDNSRQTVGSMVTGVRRFELHLGGSGGLAELMYCPRFMTP